MKNRSLASGASSYLLEFDGSTYLVTAKHLTRDEMGFSPALDLETYSDSVNYWYGLSRTRTLSKEIIETTDLLYGEDIMDDLIMLKLKNEPKEIGIFKPNFNRLKPGDRVSIIGCEYSDPDCNQKQFFGTFQQYTVVDQMEIFMDSSNIEPAGMSGAPVVDDQFRVVGHVLGGMVGEKGILKLYLAPIDLVKRVKH
ncbi:serine protease [Fluviicola taffensis]|uniref:S1 family peptidase n=1 Tax=Fluviicola taffensis TaxID=191579 RepID=UPI003137C933